MSEDMKAVYIVYSRFNNRFGYLISYVAKMDNKYLGCCSKFLKKYRSKENERRYEKSL